MLWPQINVDDYSWTELIVIHVDADGDTRIAVDTGTDADTDAGTDTDTDINTPTTDPHNSKCMHQISAKYISYFIHCHIIDVFGPWCWYNIYVYVDTAGHDDYAAYGTDGDHDAGTDCDTDAHNDWQH